MCTSSAPIGSDTVSGKRRRHAHGAGGRDDLAAAEFGDFRQMIALLRRPVGLADHDGKADRHRVEGLFERVQSGSRPVYAAEIMQAIVADADVGAVDDRYRRGSCPSSAR